MKKLKVFAEGPRQPHPEYDALGKRLACFVAGMQHHGHEYVEEIERSDLTVINSGYMPGYPRNRALEDAVAAGRPYVNIGNGFFKKDDFCAVSWNGGIKGQGDFCAADSRNDRWFRHGWRIRPWRRATIYGHVLLCGQVPSDPSVSDTDHYVWLWGTAGVLMHQTRRPIIYRPHPLDRERAPYLPGTQRSVNAALADDLARAFAVVTYNSTSAALAVLEGVPVFVCGDYSIARPVAETVLSGIERPELHDRREQWAADLAYSQWTLAEMAQGECWDHLKSGLERALHHG